MKLFDTDIKYSPGQYFEGFRIEKTIGEGRFGVCYLITDDKNLYVLKQFKKKMYRENPLKVQYEEEILKALKHEAIPGFVRKVEDSNLTGCILEYKQGITFEDMIFHQGHVFTRNEIYCIGKQVIDILYYLHGKGIVHRDIRVPNIIYNDNRIYLVDFGLARWIDDEKYKANIDFSYLGDFLIYLYYTSFTDKPGKNKPWYEELVLSNKELVFLKKLMGIEKRYRNIKEVELGFEEPEACRHESRHGRLESPLHVE
jgi:serine/threonine-protein kinase